MAMKNGQVFIILYADAFQELADKVKKVLESAKYIDRSPRASMVKIAISFERAIAQGLRPDDTLVYLSSSLSVVAGEIADSNPKLRVIVLTNERPQEGVRRDGNLIIVPTLMRLECDFFAQCILPSSSLAEMIQELRQNMIERARQARQGTPVSSMAEDAAEGRVAEVMSSIIARLEAVKSI
jgi:hypothetical protein